MKKVILSFLCLFAFTGCPKSTSSGSVLNPVQQVGCDLESAITSGFAGLVATQLNCSNNSAIQSSLQLAFGNANLCAQQTSSLAKDHLKISIKGHVEKGVISSLACPMAVSAGLGFLSNSVPSSWGCSASANASDLQTALLAACEAIPF